MTFAPGPGIPGPYPGRVVEIAHASAVARGVRDRAAVKAMVARGMRELTAAEDAGEAWRAFFQRGDRVGIKVVAAGRPLAISSHEVVLEVIDGLESAGVRREDILVFERYRNELVDANYPERLPPDIAWAAPSAAYEKSQLDIDGYDPDVYAELPYCMPPPHHDPGDERRFRSHVSTIVTQRVDKFVSIPVLKDHVAAGVTLSLKNLSHGCANNVCRSHVMDAAGGNRCDSFIPAIVSLEPIRRKAVLQILDGLVGCYEGGPMSSSRTFAAWEYGSLFFATDPVALDRVGWDIIDAKRAAKGLPPVASSGPGWLRRPRRQPQHVTNAAARGLGIVDRADPRFDHRRIDLA